MGMEQNGGCALVSSSEHSSFSLLSTFSHKKKREKRVKETF
jgi:hypothetical protein